MLAFSKTDCSVQDTEILYDSAVELAVEGEYTVPDYRPEIQKIVSCTAAPVVMQKLAVGGKATVEGFVKVTITYVTQDSGELYGLSYKLPYTKQVDLKKPVGDGAIVGASISKQYFNCRVVNKRKVDCRGAFGLLLSVRGYSEKMLLCEAHGDGVQLRSFLLNYKHVAAQSEKQFTIEEQLQIENAQQCEILSHNAFAQDVKTYITDSAAAAEGQICLTLAAGSEGIIKRYDFRLPFKQDIDFGVDMVQNGAVTASVQVIDAVFQPSEEDDSLIDAVLTCVIYAVETNDTSESLIGDIYSTEFECAPKQKALSVFSDIHCFEKPFSAVLKLESGGKGKLECEVAPVRIVRTGAAYTAGIVVTAIIKGDDGDYTTFEEEFEVPLPADSETADILGPEVFITDHSVSYDGEATVRVNGIFAGTSVDYCLGSAVDQVEMDESRKKAKCDVALTIYYAVENESVWSIAKRYNTAVDEIMAQNDLTGDVLSQRTMLLIPIVS